MRDGQELSSGGRHRVEVGERHAFLYIKAADKCDDGPYRLVLENELGQDSAMLKIQVNGESFIRLHLCNLVLIVPKTKSFIQYNLSVVVIMLSTPPLVKYK